MKKLTLIAVFLILITLTPSCSCHQEPEYFWHSEVLTEYFDTLITIIGYTKTQAEFDAYVLQAETEFARLHKLYDKYNTYVGLKNVKTVNDLAGIEPVAVDTDLLNLVKMAKDWTLSGTRKTNIALGPVLDVWHQFREAGLRDPENAQLPPLEKLKAAAEYTDPSRIIIDEVAGTIYLAEAAMSLDVGAVAKGYATELVTQKLNTAGLVSGVINAGGNVRTIGKPLDGIRDRWGIGISDPDRPIFSDDRNLDVAYVTDASVVSSGDYQRYYYVGGARYHHLIDPSTLMPADHYRALTVVTSDSGWADLLSTELFLLPYEESRALATSLAGVEVLWIMPGGEIQITSGMAEILLSQGASGRD